MSGCLEFEMGDDCWVVRKGLELLAQVHMVELTTLKESAQLRLSKVMDDSMSSLALKLFVSDPPLTPPSHSTETCSRLLHARFQQDASPGRHMKISGNRSCGMKGSRFLVTAPLLSGFTCRPPRIPHSFIR
ncbi:unnamed protein product [Pleuronectes platessa]|uniref:Uncharacterized protein n=1 Tax=Pleuronectes platessa TaxID=8262 RepID=A0A9N7YDE5_PLEPL|nr:unnamed protein product [Pleuronectes platessa]